MTKISLSPQEPEVLNNQVTLDPVPQEPAASADAPLVVEPLSFGDALMKSRKLPLIALLVLAVVGLSAVAVYSFFLRAPVSDSSKSEIVANLPTPKPFFLTVDTLKQPVTALDGEVLVKGKTLPNTTVVILSDVDEISVESDGQGNFQDTVVVGEEGGLVQVLAYGENNQEKSVTFEVSDQSDVLGKSDTKANQGKNQVKTQENQPVTAKETTTAEKTKVEKFTQPKIVELLVPSTAKPTKAKSETLLNTEAKLITGKPKQIADFLTDKTEVKKVEKMGSKKMLSLLSLESTGSAELLKNVKVKKMAVAEATSGAQLKRHAISGVITSITGGIITISHQTQTERVNTIYFNASTSIVVKGLADATGADLIVGMRIAAVGVPSSDGILASRIHVIPGKAIGVFKNHPVATGSADATPSASTKPSPTASASATPKPTLTPTPTATSSARTSTTP